ncbi:hypothetical protein ABWK22_02535 [Gottfriedia acidiceleris]|uniref:hypothetical protein n=1 Tax=Gottfriedia acidiceleris TaxID=371036 RepID=UPI0033965AFA
MATLFSNLGSGSNPTMLYTVTATETGRTSTSVTYSVTCSARLEDQTYGYYNAHVYPKIKMGSVTGTFATLGTFPKGAGTKSSTISITVTGITATTSSVSYTFSATNELGGTSSTSTGYVSGKSGTTASSIYATTPALTGAVTIKDGSTTVTSYYRENIGTGVFTLDWANATGANGTLQYELERSTNGGTWTDVNNSLTSSTTTHAPGATTTSMRYRVRAKNIVGSDTMYSGWIYSSTVTQNSMTAPTLTSSASVTYVTKSFTMSLAAATDNLGSTMTYTLSATAGKYTTINGAGVVSVGTITVNTNNGTTGIYMTLANLQTAALKGAAASDTNPYAGTIDLTITATNGKGSTKTDTISIPLDLGIDAPVVGTPGISFDNSSFYLINAVNYIFPEYKPVTLNIPAAIKDALGRNCSFDVVMREGSTDTVIKNTGIVTGATSATINHTEAGLLTTKKNVSFFVRAKTLDGLVAASAPTYNVDLHYYKKPSVTSSSLTRISGSASFKVTITPTNSLGGATNTSTMPSGYAKGTSTITTGVETYTVSSNTTLLDSYTAKISVVIRDSIGYILKADGTNDVTLSVTIPKFQPALSIREKGIGINTYATDMEMLRVAGNITFDKPANYGEGNQGALIWDSDATQGVQLRYNTYDNTRAPFGLHIEKSPLNTQTSYKAYLSVEGDVEVGNNLYMPSNGAIYSRYNGSYVFKDHANGNITVNAAGGDLYLGYVNTTKIRLSSDLVSSGALVIAPKDGSYLQTFNPTNTAATLALGWGTDIPRIRYGGSGAGSASGFEIQGPSDVMKMRVDNSGNIYSANGTFKGPANAAVIADDGYALLRASGTYDVYLQTESEVRCVQPSKTGTTASEFRPILASAFTVNSEERAKENIEEYSGRALDLVNHNGTIYEYDLKTELNTHRQKKKFGFVIGREVPEEILDYKSEGVDLYAMNSILWKAVQELSEEVKTLEKKLKKR